MYRIGNDLVALVTDSSCDLPDPDGYNIHVLPLRVYDGAVQLRDGADVTAAQLRDLAAQGAELRTACPLPEDVADLYRTLRDGGCTHILHVASSSGLGASCAVARMIAEDLTDMTIDVFDARTLSCGLGLLVQEAAVALAEGTSVDEVIRRLDRVRRSQMTLFLGCDPEPLRRSGRIALVDAGLWSLRKQTPPLTVTEEGRLRPLPAGKNASAGPVETLVSQFAGKPVNLALGGSPEQVLSLRDELLERLEAASSSICECGSALLIHGGPGAVCVSVQYVY